MRDFHRYRKGPGDMGFAYQIMQEDCELITASRNRRKARAKKKALKLIGLRASLRKAALNNASLVPIKEFKSRRITDPAESGLF